MAKILDGKKIAATVLENVRKRCEALKSKGVVPGLATVLVGEDPASHVYVDQKIKKCQEFGLVSFHKPLPASISESDLIKIIDDLNRDTKVHGMIVQLPLPEGIDPEKVISRIDPRKDADGLHPYNQGAMSRLKSWDEIKRSGIPLPCTPAGIIQMLLFEKIAVEGKNAVVVGRSALVGKPVAQLLLSLNATVTIAHSQTKNLMKLCRNADILVAALGKPHFINKEGVKKGAVVIDVGISRTENGLKGDVDFDAVKNVASWITPVPGGVGPMTVAMLLQNTVSAAEKTLQSD
ncbi:MAG: bifunctional methylenetetrahydrofolate dehydrogenase/methenyltetrahydrofolate cyclohydrolase FolD [Elusimicrobia bacterium]|nr:bifunctional methylenetetrahydrofolate dehydrogenase/methenyltetrahydrofolate cyclohydrolase FolD [Candidatus Obscuribacterium magneticum]